MKYIYYLIWRVLIFLHFKFFNFFMFFNRLIVKSGLRSENHLKDWKRNFNKASLEFPGGIIDWWCNGILVGILFIPVLIVSVRFKIDLYSNKLHFFGLASIIIVFVYYTIYRKNRSWLKDKIQNRLKNHYKISKEHY